MKTSAYWRRHVREAVRFSDGIATLHAEKIRVFVEVGPSPTLLRMAARCPGPAETAYLPSLRKGTTDTESMLLTLGELYVSGQTVNYRALAGTGAKRVSLPTYPFQRERYWHDLKPHASARAPAGKSTGHPLLGDRLTSPLRVYQGVASLAEAPWLADHAIFGVTLFPVTGFLEVALAAARDTLGGDGVVLEGVTIGEGLSLSAESATTLQVVVTPAADNKHTIEVYSADIAADASSDIAPEWRRHVSATAARETKTAPPPAIPELPADKARADDVGAYYARLAERGANYGPAFRGIQQMSIAGNEALGHIRLPEGLAAGAARMQLHPALLDACLQVVGAALPSDALEGETIFVPVGLDRFRVFREGVTDVRCHAVFEQAKPGAPFIRTNVTLFADDGATVAELRGLEFQRVTPEALQRLTQGVARPDWLLEVEWQPTETPPSRPIEPGERWLLLDHGGPLTGALMDQLARRGARATIVTHADTYERRAEGFRLDTTKLDHYVRLFQQAREEDPRPWTGIVWLPRFASAGEDGDLGALHAALRTSIAALLAVVPALADLGARLWLVTRGGQAVAGSVPDLVEGSLSALGNVIAAEYPALRVARVDLDPVDRPDDDAVLAASLSVDDGEDRIALRGGQRFVARLVTGTLTPSDAGAPHRLEIDERGVLENLSWRAVPRVPPGPGALEIRVLATGLNFRDVLNALGMYPGDPGPLGNECSGVVTAVGEGVDRFAVGDEVVTMIDQSFATFVVAPAALTVRKPPNLTFAEAATIPVTFLTAEYALTNLSHMKKGDRILVHAATGGVGMAAMQLARRAGAEIYATAGSPAKRALAQSLGASHVSDSRSLSFVDDFTKASGSEGLDIVLNSLAGDFIPASLGLLGAGGRFVEIGKTGIWDAAKVAEAYPKIGYFPLYLGEITLADPALVRGMLERLMEQFARGELTPLPQTVYPIERAEEAFRFMAQGRHTGKVVLTQHQTPEVRSDASYLVTGGLGGLGLACARGLADRGARHVVLLGRRPPSEEAKRAIDALTEGGVSVTALSGDVAVEADVAAALERIRTTLPPLRGILHAAGSVDDGMLVEQNLERFERVMAPKVAGTWHLHELTRNTPLDFFVMFSSGAALLGSPGQSNYAAANGFMDTLAFRRKAEGRHGLSINWGSWSDVGMAAALSEQHRRRWAEQGIRMIRPADGVRMLHDTLRGTRSPQVAILPLDRTRLSPALGPFFQRILVDTAKAARVQESAPSDLPKRLAEASPEGRPPLVTAFLVEQLVRVLAVDAATRLHTDQSLMDMGLDSLMAMELRNRVQSAVKVRLSVAELLTGQTIDQLTVRILDSMDLGAAPVPAKADEAAFEEGSL